MNTKNAIVATLALSGFLLGLSGLGLILHNNSASADPWSWGHTQSKRYLHCFYTRSDCTHVPLFGAEHHSGLTLVDSNTHCWKSDKGADSTPYWGPYPGNSAFVTQPSNASV
jgi:hypothetical protein